MKIYLRRVLLILFCSVNLFGQTDEFNQPWKDTTRAIVIDLYYDNTIDFGKLITDKRVAGIIHKASQGLKSDTGFNERKQLALENGILWGTYHLGTNEDPVKQADFYMDLIRYDSTQLIAIDLESLDTTVHMSLYNAKIFISRICEKTRKYPLLYCNKTVLTEISTKYSGDTVFSKCGLWYAAFRNDIPEFNNAVWSAYTLWQFSCEINCKKTGECPYNVAGTDRFMDVNIYYGTVDELKSNWPDLYK